MLPNEKQKELASIVRRQASFWHSTNDIESPTHCSDIENDVDYIEFLDDFGKEEFRDLLWRLYWFIRKDYKKYDNELL